MSRLGGRRRCTCRGWGALVNDTGRANALIEEGLLDSLGDVALEDLFVLDIEDVGFGAQSGSQVVGLDDVGYQDHNGFLQVHEATGLYRLVDHSLGRGNVAVDGDVEVDGGSGLEAALGV